MCIRAYWVIPPLFPSGTPWPISPLSSKWAQTLERIAALHIWVLITEKCCCPNTVHPTLTIPTDETCKRKSGMCYLKMYRTGKLTAGCDEECAEKEYEKSLSLFQCFIFVYYSSTWFKVATTCNAATAVDWIIDSNVWLFITLYTTKAVFWTTLRHLEL